MRGPRFIEGVSTSRISPFRRDPRNDWIPMTAVDRYRLAVSTGQDSVSIIGSFRVIYSAH
jgi:hypothetical protein